MVFNRIIIFRGEGASGEEGRHIGNAEVGFSVAKVGRLGINGTLRFAALTFSVWFHAQLYCTNDCQERTSLVLATYNKYIPLFCAQKKNIFSIPLRVFFVVESLI